MEQELVVGRGQHVDVLQVVGHRQSTDELRGVDEDERPDGSGDAADYGDLRAVPGRTLHAAEGDDPGALVDGARHVVGFEAPVAEGHLANVVPLRGELAPGEVV